MEALITMIAFVITLAIIIGILCLPGIFIFQILSYRKKKKIRREEPKVYPPEDDIEWIFDEKTQLWTPKDQYEKNKCNIPNQQVPEPETINFRKAYQARYLLTKHEWYEFKKLRDIADVKGYIICPKVRLLDIIEPIKGQKKYKTLFYKIQAKHVDFVICDRDMHIKAIIELDDSSHQREDRQERDQFVNLILRSVGYTVIHTYAVTPDILDLV